MLFVVFKPVGTDGKQWINNHGLAGHVWKPCSTELTLVPVDPNRLESIGNNGFNRKKRKMMDLICNDGKWYVFYFKIYF